MERNDLLRIINRTHWRTEHLRAFINRIAKEELTTEKRKGVTVCIVYGRLGGRSIYSAGCSGCAVIGGYLATVRVPKERVDRIDFSMVVAHEMAHLRGMTHDLMRDSPLYRRVADWRERYAWAETLPLDRKDEGRKIDVAVAREKKLVSKDKDFERKIQQWTRRLKTAQTKLRKYTRGWGQFRKRHAEVFDSLGAELAAAERPRERQQ